MLNTKSFFFNLLILLTTQAHASEQVVLSGRVLSQSKSPIGAACITLLRANAKGPENESKIPFAVSNKNGEYKLVAKPGSYIISIVHTLYCSKTIQNVDLSKGTAKIDIELSTGGHPLTGEVLSVDGKAQKSGFAIIQSVSDSRWCLYAPIREGKFDLKVPYNAFTLKCDATSATSATFHRRLNYDQPNSALRVKVQLSETPSAAKRNTIAWIRSHSVLISRGPNHNYSVDIDRLKPILDNKLIVGLGEATHGTRDFFQIKTLLAESMFEHCGFTILAVEGHQGIARELNDFILNGDGDPVKALNDLGYWTIRTEEMLELIYWMRSYNKDINHKNKLMFYGFDMQGAWAGWLSLKPFLERSNSSLASTLSKQLSPLNPSQDPKGIDQRERLKVLEAVEAVKRDLETNRVKYISNYTKPHWWSTSLPGGTQAYENARQDAELLVQAIVLLWNPRREEAMPMTLRDKYMAENLRWVSSENPGAKIILWAHNEHVSYSPGSEAFGRDPNRLSMGEYLRGYYKDRMLSIGFLFSEGGFRAVDGDARLHNQFKVVPFRLTQLHEATLTSAFDDSRNNAFLLDLRALPREGTTTRWFHGLQGYFQVGALYMADNPEKYIEYADITQKFDAIVFVRQTDAATGLRIQ